MGALEVILEVIWGSFFDDLGTIWRSSCDLVARWSQRGWGKEKIDFLCAGSQFVRAPPILRESGEPRTRKHCKNTYKMSGNFRSGARFRFYRPLIHRQNPYRMNLFGEILDQKEYFLSGKNSSCLEGIVLDRKE